VSVDLFIERHEGEEGGGQWMRIGRSLHEEFNRRAREMALMIQGRVVYEIMEKFWPAAAHDASLEPVMQEYGRIWTTSPNVLVSNTRTTAEHNTRIVGGKDAIEQLAALRANTEGLIGVGGATLATLLLEHKLLDELMLFVHPVVLGSGRPLFDNVAMPIECELIEHAAFEQGVVMHRYKLRDAS
jgi:dihydrofolate reductase